MKTGHTPLRQYWLAISAPLLTTAFFSFPRAAALLTSTAAPWAILISGGLTLLMLWPVASALAQRPGKNLTDLALAAGGRPLAIVTTAFISAFVLASAGISVRQVAEMVVTSLYPHTPQTFAMASLVMVGALGAAMSPAGAIWLASLYTLPTVGSVLLLLVGNLGWGQIRNVTPISGHGVLPTLGALLPLVSYLDPLIYLAIFSSQLTSPRHLMRAAVYATALTTVTYSMVVLFYLMIFPLPGGLDVPFPLLEMSRLVQGGRHLERLDALWIFVWAFGAAGRLTVALQASAVLFRDTFRLPDHRQAVLPLTVAVLSMALFPSNQAGAVDLETFLLRRWGFLFVPVLPAAIALVARLRRRHA